MIKLERGDKPKELTDEVCQELTRLYAEDKDKEVWKSPKIKMPLKNALLEMTHDKCAYCECRINVESKDVTIDHFLHKSKYKGKVVEWENLFPSCLRCNRKKNDHEEVLINPCENNPQDYIGITKVNRFRFKEIDAKGIGKDTIDVIGLNDIQKLMVPRMEEWELLKNRLLEIETDLKEVGYKKKYKIRLQTIMEECMPESTYTAVKATNLLNDDSYIIIKEILKQAGQWTDDLKKAELEIEKSALKLV